VPSAQTIPPQHPMRHADPQTQIWTVWTMFLWFLNTVWDQFVAKFVVGSSTVPAASSAITVVHGLGLGSYVVILSPTNAAAGGTITIPSQSIQDLWGIGNIVVPSQSVSAPAGGYWVSNKTPTQFQINLAQPAPVGGASFDWMVKAV